MRTHLTRFTRLAAAAGLALAVSPIALGAAAVAATPATPAPTPTAPASTAPSTPASTPSATTPPTDPPPALGTGKVDASVTATAKVYTEIPPMTIVKFILRSDRPATGYRLRVKAEWPTGYAAPPNHPGWDCTGPLGDYDCRWGGAATKTPAPVSLALSSPDAPGSFVRATVSTNEKDTNPDNNSVRTKVSVPAKGSGAIAGRIWHDVNGNGRQDKGEKGLAGAKVLLSFGLVGSGKAHFTGPVTTGADGRYTFTRLTPHVPNGTPYGVAVATPGKEWKFTKAGVGAETGDSDFRYIGNDYILEGRFGRGAILAFEDRIDVFPGKTTVLDAGLVKPVGAGADDGSLPVTGAGVGGIIGAGALLLVGGGALTMLARRRRVA